MEKLKFNDAATYDEGMKTAISVRDGVLEYLGEEIGQEPPDKVFTVYRSPATIANLVAQMPGIPVIGEHVEPGTEEEDIDSKVESATLIDYFDEALGSTLAIKNQLSLDPGMIAEIKGGKRELSLGYEGKLVPHDRYDFEQVELFPTHLAAVEAGRCGSGCRFMDRKSTPNPEAQMKPKKLHKAFCDADGSMSLSQIVELAAGLPEAIKNVPADKLQELLPALQEIMVAASDAGVKPVVETEEVKTEEVMTDEETEQLIDEEAEKLMDEEADLKEDVKVTDSMRRLIRAKARAKFKDKMASAIGAAVKQHAAVIEKAQGILPETYRFADKSTAQIMRDALATQHTEKFADSELPLAFKMLRKGAGGQYQSFGDSKASDNSLTARLQKELEGK